MSERNSRGGIKKYGKNSKGSGGSSQNLASQLSSVAAQAKSLGIDTSRADAMVKQTKAEGSKAFAGSSYEKEYLSTIPAKMTPETPANIPTPTVPNIGDITGQNNIGLGAVTSQFGTTYDAKTGQFVTAPTETQDNFQSLFEQATALGNTAFEEMGTAESRLKKLEKENQLKQKQQAVNETTGQINAIVAQSQAQQLALEGQGRGQTSSFIGGEQARINREAAIQAIPLQAKLAAEQGALELAQEHIDKMFTVQSQDALAKYNYKSKLIESVYNFATGAEQRRLDAIKAKEDRAYDMQKFNIQYQRDLASQAAEYGLGGVASSILKLNPTSPTFSQDIASLQSKVVKPVEAKAPTTQTVDGKLYQYDYGTGEWNLAVGSATETEKVTKDLAVVNDIDNILSNPAFNTTFGLTSIVNRNVPGNPEYALKSEIENLQADLALAARGELKGQGQVSDFEGKLLSRAQTSLKLNLNPTQSRYELTQVKGAIRTSSGLPAEVKITDPATGQSQVVSALSEGITQAVADGYRVEYYVNPYIK